MTIYTESISITLPAELADTASRIARTVDPDFGGASSFHPDPDGLTISVTTPCTPEYKAAMLRLQGDPAALHGMASADYARRWPDLVPPTLAECEAFCGAIISTEGESP